MSALNDLLALIDHPDPYRAAPPDLRALQLAAMQERFDDLRGRIKLVDQRARDAGIDTLTSPADMVPLLFAHTTYKSYPETFIDKGRWDRMNLWLQTLSGHPVENIDVAGITDADDWIARLRAAGHLVFASSGTSGKCSFMNQSPRDVELYLRGYLNCQRWAFAGMPVNKSRPVFAMFPRYGVHRMVEIVKQFAEQVARPGALYFMSDEPVTARLNIRMGQMRRAIAAGSATPEEIAAYEAETAERQRRVQADMEQFFDALFEHRGEPIYMNSMWASLYRVVEAGRARGIKDGAFHPDTFIGVGGGLKGAQLPPDYREQIQRFFGIDPSHYRNSYSMVEMNGICPWHDAAQGHVMAPWVVPLVLDKSGEHWLDPDAHGGVVEGRLAFYDLLQEGRWGGIISGDKVTVDFNAGGGFNGPKIKAISRYSDLPEGDDKLSCAGTIEAYVRGAINE